MYQNCYAEIMEDSAAVNRARERDILDRCVELLRAADMKGRFSRESIEALTLTRKTWNALLEDLTHSDNHTPESLKASLVSLGIWVLKECDKIRKRESTNYGGLIDVTRAVSAGLN